MYTLSLLIFTNTETDSLEYTIKQFISLVDVPYRVTVLLKTAHCPSAAVMQRLMAEHPHWKISTAVQKTQDKFQYFQELSSLASGTHFMVWPSDNEVDIAHVKDLLAVSKASPDAIVSLSKFHKDSVLDG
ncbi:MAG: hypothetical protein IJG23_01205 [Clostridia bacterium]|nr:hypothetical protein [Clostridia bacterium]